MIKRLMCDMAVDLDAVAKHAGLGIGDYFVQELESLAVPEREGLVDIEGHQLRVTQKGRPFLRILASTFDTYLQEQPARHTMAV
ncbi:MAG TPA: hypothetical protein VGI22_15005 [Xanthobacteraceae bacterium]